MGKSSAPTPPNPIVTAAAQTGTNVASGVANAYLNNVNQITPQGNVTYSPGQAYSWQDPLTGASYSIPTFTATQTLAQPGSPYYNAQQANIAGQTNQAQIGQTLSGQLLNQANTGQLNVDPNFDEQTYLSRYPDLMAYANQLRAQGQDPTQWVQSHWQQFGQYEGRNAAKYQGGDPNTINPGNALTAFGDAGQQQTGVAYAGQQQGQFGATGMPIQNTLTNTGQQRYDVGPQDFSADRNKVEDALMQRINPSLNQQRQRLEQQLADQGINYGSEAYNNAIGTLNQQQTDARFAAINQAGQEQARMQQQLLAQGQFYNQAQQTAYQQALQSGQFANAAEAQAFAEAKARGEFANAAQAEQYKQNLQTGQFANTAQAQNFQQQALRGQFANQGLAQQLATNQAQYNAQNTSRTQWLAEQYDKANQGINQISSLLSGSQVAKPSFVTPSNNQIATTDVAGLINNNFSQSLAAYNANNSQFNQLFGGILGGLAGVLSDEREKNVGDKVGTIFAAGPDGEKPLPIYEFDYKRDPTGTRHIGPMAQDVEKIDRSAVRTIDGVKYIEPTRMGSILRPHVLKKVA